MKKTILMILVLATLFCTCLTAFGADETKPLLVDDVGLLDPYEAVAIRSKLIEVSKKVNADVVVAIVTDIGLKSVDDYAVDYFNNNGYGAGNDRDGIIFLFVTTGNDHAGSRDSYIFPSGRCKKKIDCKKIYDEIEDFFAVNNYEAGFCGYADSCLKQMSYNFGKSLLISFVIGIVIALIVVMRMKSKLKTVRAQSGAAEYTRENSLNITRSREIYLYSTVSSVKKEKESNSSGGSGSSSHAGAGRKL